MVAIYLPRYDDDVIRRFSIFNRFDRRRGGIRLESERSRPSDAELGPAPGEGFLKYSGSTIGMGGIVEGSIAPEGRSLSVSIVCKCQTSTRSSYCSESYN